MEFIEIAEQLAEEWKGLESVVRKPGQLKGTGKANYDNGFSYLVLDKRGRVLGDLPNGVADFARSSYRTICEGRYSELGEGQMIQRGDYCLLMPNEREHALAMQIFNWHPDNVMVS